jgi:hypothetical protein
MILAAAKDIFSEVFNTSAEDFTRVYSDKVPRLKDRRMGCPLYKVPERCA